MPPRAARTALVLSAGGVRGAYQVGVIAGILELLGPCAEPVFDTFVGASIGAINSAYLAANANQSNHAIDGLVQIWTHLDFDEILQCAPMGPWGWPRLRMPGHHDPQQTYRYIGRSLLDPRPVEDLLARVIPWEQLHANVRAKLVRGLMIAALDICDGTTTVFTELAEGVNYPPYPYLTSRSLFTTIDEEHVLAATALPFIFPARKVADRYYMDGALRFETPIIPALRAGARRVVVISLLDTSSARRVQRELVFPGFFFLTGQLLSALLLDPLLHDVDMLRRNNRILDVMAETLDPPTTMEVIASLEAEVPPGRPVPALVLQPSARVQQLTREKILEDLRRKPLRRALLRWLADFETGQSLLASFLYFEGGLAARLIELGHEDALAQRDRILAFFDKT